MSSATDHYASFIVRLWQENRNSDTGVAVYRAEVEHIQSGETRCFVNPLDLWNYLSSGVLLPPGTDGSYPAAGA
jgi:hypothetical protein